MGALVDADERIALLRDIPAFADVSPAALRALADVLVEESYPCDTEVIVQGNPVDKLYIVARGRTEVSSSVASGTLTLAAQEPGEMFGELALLSDTRRRVARTTVRALSELLALTTTVEPLPALVARFPELLPVFQTSGEVMLVARFLKRATPFAKLPPKQIQWLASKLEHIDVEPGEIIVHQNDPGDFCFLVRAGRVDVIAHDEKTGERKIASLGPGAMVGEAALLSEEPRNATVRATRLSELLILRRQDLLEAMRADRSVGSAILEMLRLRDRPRRIDHAVEHRQITPDGVDVTILKNPRRNTYYRLSKKGYFIWERLDGERTLRDLTLEYRDAFGSFVPHVIADLIEGLSAAGFVVGRRLLDDVEDVAPPPPTWHRATLLARQAMELQVTMYNVDAILTGLFRAGGRLLFTRAGQASLALLTLLGFAAFVASSVRAATFIADTNGGAMLLVFLIPAEWLSVIVHEAGHALTAKAFGRDVSRVGIGWYWFGPVTFVDTSDMWLAGKGQRIAVSLAGPYANVLLASLATPIGLVSSDPFITALCWQFALTSYVVALLNLNPLLEYDGYYVLMDLLDRPNLRVKALEWLGQRFLPTLRHPGRLAQHRVELLYGIASLVYIGVMAAGSVIVYRLVVQTWIAVLVPGAVAAACGWLVAAAVLVITAGAVAGDLRGVRARQASA